MGFVLQPPVHWLEATTTPTPILRCAHWQRACRTPKSFTLPQCCACCRGLCAIVHVLGRRSWRLPCTPTIYRIKFGARVPPLRPLHGWDLHASGELRGPGNTRIHLRQSSASDVKSALAYAWAHRVRNLNSHRNGLAQVDIPDLPTTVGALAAFSAADQRTLARHITGCFQTAATKVLWKAVDTPACPWCGGHESRQHRFLHCPAFASVRERHQQAVQALESRFPHWVYCPFATMPEEADITRLLFMSRPPPPMPEQEAAHLREEGCAAISAYTDGTCAFPGLPHARHAAWGLVLNFASTPQQQDLAATFWRHTGCVPPCFQVRGQGLVPGKQTVNRAELLAALQVVRLGHLLGQIPTHIHTDSAYVVRILSQFSAGLSASLLDSFANVDLLRLLEEVWFDKVSFTKVRSHRDPHTAVDQEDLLTILGNSKADEACARALQADLPVVADMVAATATSQDEQASLLRDVYRYLLNLRITRSPIFASTSRGTSSRRLWLILVISRRRQTRRSSWTVHWNNGVNVGNAPVAILPYLNPIATFSSIPLGDQILLGSCGSGHSNLSGRMRLSLRPPESPLWNFSAILWLLRPHFRR